MEMRIRKAQDIVIIELEGPINIDSAEFIEITTRLVREGALKLVCSLQKVEAMDYDGLSILTIGYKNVVNKNATMKLCNVPVHIKELLKMVRMDLVFIVRVV